MAEQADKLEKRRYRVGEHEVFARMSERPGSAAPPVILVPGLGLSSRYMVPAARRLARFYPVYAPDPPGFGNSSKPEHVLDVSELAHALHAWMDAAGIGRAVLIGNSMGCQVLVDLAVRHPEKVDRAVLVGPSVDPHARTAPQQIRRLLADVYRERPSLIFLGLRDYAKAGLPHAWKTFRHALADRIEEKLPLVQAPTLVVCGSRDPIVPRRWAQEATGLLRHGRLAVIPGGPHAVHYTLPDAFVRRVREFLAEDPAGEATLAEPAAVEPDFR